MITIFALLAAIPACRAQNIVAPQAAQTQIIAVDGTPVTITGAGTVTMAAPGDAIVLTSNSGGAGVTVTLDAGTGLTTLAGASGIGVNINTGSVTNNGTITTNGVGSSQGITIVTATADIVNSATGIIITNNAGGGTNSDGIRLDVGNVINSGNITTTDGTSAAIIIDPNGTGTAGGKITNNGNVTTNGAGSPALVNNTSGDITNSATGVVTTNGGTAASTSDGILFGNGSGNTATNAGTININGVGSGINVGGSGDIVVNSGTINLNGASNASQAGILSTTNGGNSITHTGTITISAAAAGAHGISVSTGDTILLGGGGGTINVNGANSNAINSTGGATITSSSTLNVGAASSFGINLAGNDTVNYSGTMNVASFFSGVFSNGGGNTINQSGVINMTAGGFFAIAGINTNGNDIVNNSGTINGAAGVVTGIFSTGSGNTITNSGNIIMAGVGTGISSNGGDIITNSGTITTAAGNGINDQAGTGSTITNAAAGTININGGGALVHGIDSLSTSITNDGTINISSAGTAVNTISAGATVTQSGTGVINMNGNGDAFNLAVGGGTINDAGILNINGNGTSLTAAAGDTYNHSGTININGSGTGISATGNAIINGTGGTINMGAAGSHGITVTGTGNRVTSGNITLNAANGNNAINSAGGNNIANSGTITINGAGNGIQGGVGDTITNSGTFIIPGGGNGINYLGGATSAASVTNSGNIIVGAGGISGGGSAINLTAGGAAYNIINSGTVTVTGGGSFINNPGAIAFNLTNSGTIADSNTAIFSGIITGVAGATINNSGTITDTAGGATGAADAIITGGATVNNSGNITLSGGGFGVFANAAGGSITNSGTITTTGAASFGISENSGNTINHTGTITTSGAGAHGIAVNSATASTMNISGTINASGAGSSAIFSFTNNPRTVNINGATLSSGSAQVIQLGNANDTVNIQGRVNISGTVDGGGAGADTDTLTFSNMRLSQSLISDLQSAAANPAGTVQLFGSTFSWNDFENVTVDLGSVASYSSLLTSDDTSSFGLALDSVSSFNDADLVAFLTAFDAIPVADLEATAINVIGQDMLQSMSATSISTTTQFTNSFMRRLPGLIGSTGGINTSNFSVMDASLDPLLASTQQHLAYNAPRLSITDSASLGLSTTAASTATGRLNYQELYPEAAAAAIEPENRFVVEVIGSGTLANQDATSDRPESNYFITTATLRGGYRINQDTTVGAYAGYNGGKAETDAIGSELEYQGGHAGIFGQYDYKGFRFVGLAGYTYSNYDSDRVIAFPGINRTAEGETDSNQVIAAGEIAYDFILGPNYQWKVTPVIGLQYTHLWIDGYQESGAGALSLNVGDQEVDSLQTKIGLEASKLWQYNGMSHITFFASGFWHHEVLDNSRTVNAAFNSTAINNFTVRTEDPERDFAIMGAGLDAVPFRNQDVHLLLGYQNQFGQEGFMSHTLYGGYRRDF
ncbi:MAG: autotransporter domain-containing protein [Verrucomicrobiota bacterium]